MPSVPVHANNSCLAAYVEKRRNEINNMQVSAERSILPILLDSLKANIINVKDSATTINLICILSVCTHQHYIRIRHTLLQEDFPMFRAMRSCADHRGDLPVQVGLLPIFRAGHPST